MLLQELHRLADDIAAAAGAGRRAARLDAHHAVVALDHEVLDAQFLGVELHRFERVDDGRREPLGEREGRVVLGIAADLQHALAELGERDRKVRRRRALADAALAVDGEHLRGADLQRSGRAATWTLPSPSGLAGGSEWAVKAFTGVSSVSCGDSDADAFEAVFEFLAGAAQRLEGRRVGRPIRRSWASSSRVATLAEAVGFSAGQALAHRGVEHEGLGDLLVDPGRDLARGGRPADGVGDVVPRSGARPRSRGLSMPSYHLGFSMRVRVSSATCSPSVRTDALRRASGRRYRPGPRRRRARWRRRGRCRPACRSSGRPW